MWVPEKMKNLCREHGEKGTKDETFGKSFNETTGSGKTLKLQRTEKGHKTRLEVAKETWVGYRGNEYGEKRKHDFNVQTEREREREREKKHTKE